MTNPIRIANCSGFYGDRLSAAQEMVQGGPIDALTGDWLAELTMLILARTRAKRPGGGYARTFLTQMEQVMGNCLDRGIKVVSNAGGLDVRQCAEAVADIGDRLGLAPRVAYVNGDNLMGRIAELRAAGVELVDLETGSPVSEADYISANAYIGCWGIVEALASGADIVVTGRTTDAAVVCGPAAWHHGWARDDWDQLAGAVVAGHVIECGTQATGGNYSFFQEISGLERAGFPIAEVASDGSSVITKHPGTGGAVTIGTVTSQLLYEIGGPRYLGPDVTARFDSIRLDRLAPDRIAIREVTGEPPPDTLKVSMNAWGGYRSDIAIALTGIDIEAKAELVRQAFWRAAPVEPGDFESVTTTVVRTDHDDPNSNEAATASWRITVKDRDERKCKAIGVAVNELALATIPGFYGLGRGGLAKPFGVHTSALVPADVVPQQVVMLDAGSTVIESTAPQGASRSARAAFDGLSGQGGIAGQVPPRTTTSAAAMPVGQGGTAGQVPPRTTTSAAAMPVGQGGTAGQVPPRKGVDPVTTVKVRRVPLGTIVGARSGDKGPNANLGLFTRSEAAYLWLSETMTVERLRELLPEAAELEIERHLLSNIAAINFVIYGILQEGVAASTRQDGQAKSLGEWLRARHVDIPIALLEEHTPWR